ncbi:MAG: hypothetical protein ACRC7N_02635, partial [Clostridium sp.]
NSTTDKKYVDNDEIYNTRLIIKNISNENLSNIVIKNIIPPNAKVTNYPIKINDVEDLQNHLALGINISNLDVGKYFDIIIPLKSNLINGGEINHSFKISFEYYDYVNESYIQMQESFDLPKVYVKTTNITLSNIIFKTNYQNPSIGDRISLFLSIKNTGNISANNTLVSIILPEEVQRYEDTIIVNDENFNIPKGIREIKIGKIDVTNSVNIEIPLIAIKNTTLNISKLEGVITFDTFIVPNQATKHSIVLPVIPLKISSPNLIVTYEASNILPIVNDSIDILYFIKNEGNEKSIDTKLFLNISESLMLKNDLIQLEGISIKKDDLLLGIPLGNIDINQEKFIKLSFLCNDTLTITKDLIAGKLIYKYSSSDYTDLRYNENIIEPISLTIYDANCSLNLTKDKDIVILGDIITFSISVENTGNLEALNIL